MYSRANCRTQKNSKPQTQAEGETTSGPGGERTEVYSPEPLLTVKAAAKALGIPYFKLNMARKQGLFPVYRIGNGRALVRLSEIDAAIRRSQDGGSQ